ncbi:MAG: tRNA 2-thiouridine(34) synthase MnmA [Rickettsiales bacterium]
MASLSSPLAPIPFALGQHRPPRDVRVVVAMSGGVDSSVVAAALHAQGYDVAGVTLQLYDAGEAAGRKGACCAGKDIYDAAEVARSRGFPHYVFNYQDVFRQEVIDAFADSYVRGETPVPCVECNKSVKFRDLWKAAKELGADALATGHYVRRVDGENGPELRRARDFSKDQSYFLYATTQEQLAFMHFPLGAMEKSDVRALALELGLSVADKPDSQDICFVPNGKYGELVAKLRPGALDPGPIRHVDGRVIGEHSGVIHYTVGQRRGLGIGWSEPLYVVGVDPALKTVTVGPEDALKTTVFFIGATNALDERLTRRNAAFACIARHRSTHAGCDAVVTPMGEGRARVEVKTPERAVTPGQACVLYDGDHVLGGGTILRSDALSLHASAA